MKKKKNIGTGIYQINHKHKWKDFDMGFKIWKRCSICDEVIPK